MDAKNIQKVTGVSRTIVYRDGLHKMDNDRLKKWLRSKIATNQKARENMENAEAGYKALLSILENV